MKCKGHLWLGLLELASELGLLELAFCRWSFFSSSFHEMLLRWFHRRDERDRVFFGAGLGVSYFPTWKIDSPIAFSRGPTRRDSQ